VICGPREYEIFRRRMERFNAKTYPVLPGQHPGDPGKGPSGQGRRRTARLMSTATGSPDPFAVLGLIFAAKAKRAQGAIR